MRLTVRSVAETLNAQGIVLAKTPGIKEYRVFPAGKREEPYFASDLQDALATGLAMAEHLKKATVPGEVA